jgi:TatD DNase family protein
MFIDSHAHLDSADFEPDRGVVIQRAKAAGVTRILVIGSGTGPGTLDCAIKLAETFGGLDASIGIHPHEAALATEDDFRLLTELSMHSAVIAWGEIGLDFHYDHSPRDVQREVFARQLRLASERRLPVIIHTREAEEISSCCVAWDRQRLVNSTLLFRISRLRKWVGDRFLISFQDPPFPKGQSIREVAKLVPMEPLLKRCSLSSAGSPPGETQ